MFGWWFEQKESLNDSTIQGSDPKRAKLMQKYLVLLIKVCVERVRFQAWFLSFLNSFLKFPVFTHTSPPPPPPPAFFFIYAKWYTSFFFTGRRGWDGVLRMNDLYRFPHASWKRAAPFHSYCRSLYAELKQSKSSFSVHVSVRCQQTGLCTCILRLQREVLSVPVKHRLV